MRRAAIYSRYSTDKQDERSITDQEALWAERAPREDLAIVARYSDSAASSASMHGRPGLATLLADARAGKFDVMLVECLDRLSRSQTDLPWLYERLTFLGIAIIAYDEGPIDELRIGVRSITGPIALQDIRNKVRRGMAGVIRDGRHAGGRTYGYRPNPGRKGELSIDEAEAEIVRRIFRAFASGQRPNAIAASLNRDHVPPARGRAWNASTINGSRTRGYGILLNELYRGVIVWNRVRMLKNPDTGRRVSRCNPAEDILRSDAPHLRIVDDELWQKVQAIKAARGNAHFSIRRRPKRLLSGLLKCGCCGSSLALADVDHSGKRRLRCTGYVESGTCDNNRKPYVEDIEERVLSVLREKLREPKFFARYIEEYNHERRRLAAEADRDRGRIERRAGEVERELERALDAIVKGIVDPETLREKILALESERNTIATARAQAAATEGRIVTLHPGAVARYRADIDGLAAAFARGAAADDTEATERLRALVARVIVTPHQRGFNVEIEGRLSLLVDDRTLFPSGLKAVAGDGFEPPTRGL